MEPGSPALQADSLLTELWGKPKSAFSSSQWCVGKRSTTCSLFFSICWFPWCKYNHCVQFQTSLMRSVKVGFKGDWKNWFLQTCKGQLQCTSGAREVSESRSVVSDSVRSLGLHSPWTSPGLSLLQGIFPTQGSNPVSCIAGRFFTSWTTRGAQKYWSG